MQTTKIRGAADRRTPHTPASLAQTVRRAPVQTEWAWPGMTRAQLRELVIDQIG